MYGLPVMAYQSALFGDAARTRTNTPSGTSTGGSTSSTRTASADPNLVRTAALTMPDSLYTLYTYGVRYSVGAVPVNENRAARKPLSRELIVRTAMELADQDGLQALSMRNLAGRLHVTPMSLYNHVANKDEILDALIEAVFAEIELPDASEWKTAIRRSALSARDALIRHPWATSLWMTRQGGGASRMRHANWVLATLRTAGLSEEVIFHAYHILESHLLGSTLQQLNFPYQGEELADMARTFLREFPMDEYPDMVEHIRQHIEPSTRSQTGFEFALDLILDGLERAQALGERLDEAEAQQ